MLVLGLETTCDETAAAVVDEDRCIRGHALHSQIADHSPYGGVVPELAARGHLEHLDGLIAMALSEAGADLHDIDAVAAAAGPGLIGGVMVGTVTAKALAWAAGCPFVAVNHLEGHALSVRLSAGIDFPYLLLLVSGGHSELLAVRGVGDYRRYGAGLDDAAGEAFDKTAKILGLGFPGGPALENAARQARNPERFSLPRPMLGRADCDFSFAGLKTAMRRKVRELTPDDEPLLAEDQRDLAAAFQGAACDCLVDRTRRALERFRHECPRGRHLAVAGGVAANGVIRTALRALAAECGYIFIAPPAALCTDNGAMIAWAGLERFRLGLRDPLDFRARPRWPLDPPAGVEAIPDADAAPVGMTGGG